jgi:hypothetical protein
MLKQVRFGNIKSQWNTTLDLDLLEVDEGIVPSFGSPQ